MYEIWHVICDVICDVLCDVLCDVSSIRYRMSCVRCRMSYPYAYRLGAWNVWDIDVWHIQVWGMSRQGNR